MDATRMVLDKLGLAAHRWARTPPVELIDPPTGPTDARAFHPVEAGRRAASPVSRYLRDQIAEIQHDEALRYYGLAMAFLHVVTFMWWIDQRVIVFLHAGAEPICWPIFQECARLRGLSPSGVAALLMAYFALSLVVGALFLRKALIPWAYGSLVLLNGLKFGIMMLDFRLRMNQHYMGFFATFAFLFVPGKRNSLRVLIMLFYFWAGTLKVNWEWISGAALYRPLWFFTGWGVIPACVYVLVLELAFSWGLLARRRWIFWTVLGQLVVFHIMSWSVVRFFYPLLMFAILAIYPMCRLLDPRDPPGGLLRSLWTGRERWPVYALAALFSLLQLTPHAYPGDHAITGEGRLLALHMFDARTVCNGYADLKEAGGGRTRHDLKLKLDTRIACDPIVFYNRARSLCRGDTADRRAFEDLDLFLWARRATEVDMKPVVEIENFCGRDIRYSPLWHNPWILAR